MNAMEANDLDDFGEMSSNNDSFGSDGGFRNTSTKRYRPTPKRLVPPLPQIDFEKYVKDSFRDKIKIIDRATFQQIKKPIVIFFNHFREKCAYHQECLLKFYNKAIKYGDRIEFIAADILDIDVINSKWHPINLFCRIGNPEKGSALVYAIDEQKRIYEYINNEKKYETLTDLCENLLQGRLFNTESLSEPNNDSLVKICVYENYKELVTNSSKFILLIVSLEDYSDHCSEYKINFETVAEQLQPCNVDVVYLNGEKNYVPFELGIEFYPSALLLSEDDKTKYVDLLLRGNYTQDNIVSSVQYYVDLPDVFNNKTQLGMMKNIYQPLKILPDMKIDFNDLQSYLLVNCLHHVQVFDRETFQKSNGFLITAFMDFQNEQCLSHHLKWIDKIYQVAKNLSSPRVYFIADLKDIDVINPSWKPQDFRKHAQPELMTPKVFGMDLNRNKFVLKDFKNAASLFYFAYSLTNGELYVSEPWPYMKEDKLVKTCIADSLDLSINSMKTDIFLAIYYSNTENYEVFLQLLDDIARELEALPLKVMKIDSRLNCIPLELDNSMYPIMYFIPLSNKSNRIRFPNDNLCKEEIVEFIKQNIQENKFKI